MKKYLVKIYNAFIYYLKHNKQFCSYVILSILCTSFVRFYTNGNVSIRPLLFDIGVPIVIGSLCYLRKPKKQFGYLFFLLILIASVCMANSIYYKFYSSYVSFSLITSLQQVGGVTDAFFEKIRIVQFIYYLAPIIFYMINRRLNNKDYFNYVTKIEKNKLLFKRVLITGFVILAIGASTLSKTAYSRLAKQWNREYVVNRFGISIYQINDLINTLKPTINSWFGYDVAYKNFTEYYSTINVYAKNDYTNIFKDYNIVFVHMESITTFLVDLNVNGVDIAPNLRKLTKEGLYFSNFYPQIGVGTSSDTEFTLSTSLMPSTNGTVFVSYYDRDYPSIQKLLRDNGYYTFSMHGNKASMWNRNKMHPSLGYMDFYSDTSYDIDEVVGLGLSDKSFFRQSISILENIEENNEKYMGTIITLSNHTPFDNNELFDQIDLTYKTKVYDENKGEYVSVTYPYLEGTKLGDYIRSSHYADEALGDFINYINNSDYFNNTLFIFYGDHDPKLALEEYYNYYNFDFKTGTILRNYDDGFVDYDYYANELNKKTPLIFWTKNKKLSKEIDYYMGMIDIYPTVSNMIGIYGNYNLGHDIFSIKDDNIIAFPNGNFLTSKIYYRNAREEYKILNSDEILSDEYIKNAKEYTDTIIDVSDGIIVHDLIRASKNKETNKEIK